jgi:hypothetical protein
MFVFSEVIDVFIQQSQKMGEDKHGRPRHGRASAADAKPAMMMHSRRSHTPINHAHTPHHSSPNHRPTPHGRFTPISLCISPVQALYTPPHGACHHRFHHRRTIHRIPISSMRENDFARCTMITRETSSVRVQRRKQKPSQPPTRADRMHKSIYASSCM